MKGININQLGKQLNKKFVVTITNLPSIAICEKITKKELRDIGKDLGIGEYTQEDHSNYFSLFYVQCEDAQNLLNDVPENIKPEHYLLWYLDSSGIFENCE